MTFFLFTFTRKLVVYYITLLSTVLRVEDFFLLWDWWYGLSKTKNDKNAPKNFSPWTPKNMLRLFAYIFKKF